MDSQMSEAEFTAYMLATFPELTGTYIVPDTTHNRRWVPELIGTQVTNSKSE